MPTFRIKASETVTYIHDVEADTLEEAIAMVEDGDSDGVEHDSTSQTAEEYTLEGVMGWNAVAHLFDKDHTHPFNIKIHCRTCRSEEVTRDACARWNVETQRWELTTVYDNADCDDCGGESRLVERHVTDGSPVGKYDKFDGEE